MVLRPRPEGEKELAEDLKSADKVKWKSHGGEARGHVVKKQTSPTQIKGRQLAASRDDPQFIVETGRANAPPRRPRR